MKSLHRLKTGDAVLQEQLADPAFRAEWERTALARAVALRLIRYRVEHGLSQTQLARLLGVKQPAVARLEAGGHAPSLATLLRISGKLGIEFFLDIAPTNHPPAWVSPDAEQAIVVTRIAAPQVGSQALIAAS